MKIPLTLAIIPALTISSEGDRYAIPQVSLLELVRLEGEQIQKAIEDIHGARSIHSAATCCRSCTSSVRSRCSAFHL